MGFPDQRKSWPVPLRLYISALFLTFVQRLAAFVLDGRRYKMHFHYYYHHYYWGPVWVHRFVKWIGFKKIFAELFSTSFNGVWTQFFFKHIECYNFQIITEMYIKVYISGMEMSQRIHFWYQILLKMMIFWENGKKPLFWSKMFVTS